MPNIQVSHPNRFKIRTRDREKAKTKVQSKLIRWELNLFIGPPKKKYKKDKKKKKKKKYATNPRVLMERIINRKESSPEAQAATSEDE